MSAARLVVLLFTLLTLPVYGLAGVTQRTCQEQMSASGHTVQAGDCCPGKADQGTPCKQSGDGPGKGSCTACKAGYNCKTSQSFEPSSVWVLFSLPARTNTPSHIASILISHSPDGLWRPPTLS
ncbi:MAG: hypothetical protein JSR66_13890 [Proteobacteria bacterium]|nr:hypothetical protein [Pseudomonadota bacterium]